VKIILNFWSIFIPKPDPIDYFCRTFSQIVLKPIVKTKT